METHSSTLAWKIPWTEEPGRLQSMGSIRVRHDWASSLSLFTFMHWRRKWQPTPVFLPGESQERGEPGGLPSLGSHRVGHDWRDLAAAAVRISHLVRWWPRSLRLVRLPWAYQDEYHGDKGHLCDRRIKSILCSLSWLTSQLLHSKFHWSFCMSTTCIYFC